MQFNNEWVQKSQTISPLTLLFFAPAPPPAGPLAWDFWGCREHWCSAFVSACLIQSSYPVLILLVFPRCSLADAYEDFSGDSKIERLKEGKCVFHLPITPRSSPGYSYEVEHAFVRVKKCQFRRLLLTRTICVPLSVCCGCVPPPVFPRCDWRQPCEYFSGRSRIN